MNYLNATVAVYDYDRELAGGLPKGSFLIAAGPEEGDYNFILLRILGEARLPNAQMSDETRQQGIEDMANEGPWSDALDPWVQDRVSLHGIKCSILGSFQDRGGRYKFAEDTDNFYSVNKLMVWKPDSQTLDVIVNHSHRSNPISLENARSRIGETRFAAAERENAVKADVFIDPTDLLQRRTVYLGMSRSGKSNAMKITAEAVYRLREGNDDYRIGQLIFDPNGEYAQDNPQDGPGLHRIHETLDLPRSDEVETYGLFIPPSDPQRTIMRINFFGDQFPPRWLGSDVATALDQMLAGREIIREIMADETARYTTAFRDADLSIPPNAASDPGAQVRYKRAVLAYQTALAAAGFATPLWQPSTRGLFGAASIIDAMKSQNNQGANNEATYDEAARILERSSQRGGQITWPLLETVFSALNQFIDDNNSNYQAFERRHIARTGSSGDRWADPRLRNILRIFETQNGPRSFQRAQEQHDASSQMDFASKVVDDLKMGKLVIVDQSTGDPVQNVVAAERIMWRVFRDQQEAFRSATSSGGRLSADKRHILVYVEEAHNLLPRERTSDILRTVWARSAKEGAK